MKKILVILSLLPSTIFSQEFEIVDTIFLDKNWIETSVRSEAHYYRGTLFNDADSTYLVHDYYLDNFSIQMRGVYKSSVKNSNQIGKFQYFYKNGKLRAVYNFEQGKFHGELFRYYENGNIESIENYSYGNLKDTVKYFYESGLPKEVKVVNNDFDPENFAAAEKEFRLLSYWDITGEQQIVNGDGIKSEYYTNGRKRTTIEYSDGYPNGEWVQYNEKKKIQSKMIFKEGLFISGVIYNKRKKDVFSSLYREPRYPNGIKALDFFIQKNTNKCKEAIRQEIMVMVYISETGEATFDQILTNDISHCQFEELQEMVKHMPKWIPAVRYGVYVESTYVIRVKY